MGVCKKCKYYTTRLDLDENNKKLLDLLKAKKEQELRLSQKENNVKEDNDSKSEEDSPTQEEPSENEEDIETLDDDTPIEDESSDTIEEPSDEISDESNSEPVEDSGNTSTETEEELIVIPEGACFKFVIPPPKPNPFIPPLRIRKEKFLPPPITPMDMFHICSHPDNIKYDHIKGDKWYRCCAIFNRFEECLKFEELENNITETTPDTSDVPNIDNPTPPEDIEEGSND